MSGKDKWVRRFTVDETSRHKNGFTIYKITSVLFPIDSPEALTVISVWKRYSDVQRLHTSMRSLHAGLHLRGTFPQYSRSSYFKRFQQEVIEERAKAIKTLLEFIAEHRLLFTSTDFVNFLQTGYPEPEPRAGGVINAIRSSLHLPIEESPPLEYQTDDDDSRSPQHSARTLHNNLIDDSPHQVDTDEVDFISQIPIYEAADVELRESPKTSQKLSRAGSFDSINSLDSINSDLYDELNKLTIEKSKPAVKKSVLPDLINFDAPSTSKFEDYHTMPKTDSETTSISSTFEDSRRSSSRMSLYSKRSVLSMSNVECKTKTEDSYVFEAGYMLNLAARCEDMGDFQRAFECYKSGIEKMLIGVQSDTDPQRRALIKEKTNKYLSYAESIYKNHLSDAAQSLLPEREDSISKLLHCPIPISMLKRPYEDLALYRVLAILGSSIMLVLHTGEQSCYAMKVIQKIPNNLTEFDEYFLQRTNETRQPLLPTVIPYMVPLHAYIETNNLLFLILAYAPGEKLFHYIKNYVKSLPSTPARELNLENVFAEPKKTVQTNDINSNDSKINETIPDTDANESLVVEVKESVNNNKLEIDNSDISVKELVVNSQRLLLNVDRVLSVEPNKDVEGAEAVASYVDRCDNLENTELSVYNTGARTVDLEKRNEVMDKLSVDNVDKRGGDSTPINRLTPHARDVLPPSAVCKWGAEILTALESLHNSGVICRDLSPSNILLGDRGQVILTYFVSYPGMDMCLSKLRAKSGDFNLYIAPELYLNTFIDIERDESMDRVCDYWSFGAIMYELLCGVPLSYYHRGLFTSHTILQLPDGLSVEVESLLTQLLTYEPSERLGSGKDGIDEIKRHPYFRHIDWRSVYDSWIVPD